MRRLLSILAGFLLVALAVPSGALAQTNGTTASYAAGWNMVGGPPGTDLSQAAAVDGYSGGSYFTPATAATALCQGYWAYFADPTSITLAAGATGPTQACALQRGWNLVGNPFAGAAQLPSGSTAYHWSPDAGRYDVVSAIPPGGAVWFHSSTAASLTLTYVPVVTRAPMTLIISTLASVGAYRIHVGDAVKLFREILP
jgi:hypothetical protein